MPHVKTKVWKQKGKGYNKETIQHPSNYNTKIERKDPVGKNMFSGLNQLEEQEVTLLQP